MAMRRDRGSLWPEPFDRAFDWSVSPFETFRQFLDTESVKVDEFIEGGELVVRAELPGVDPDRDVDISIIDGNLQIRAERRQEEVVEHRNYRRNEIRYGSLSRVLPLPPNIKEDDIKASYHDGVLEVRAPIDNRTQKPSKIRVSRD